MKRYRRNGDNNIILTGISRPKDLEQGARVRKKDRPGIGRVSANIPFAREVEANGLQVVKMNKLLLEEVEELTLYILKNDKEINHLKVEQNP
ncbi:MAG: hypothetical protein AAFX53_14790 [Bacteroidota bacterium]